MDKRTILDFEYSDKVKSIVEDWAQDHDYKIKGMQGDLSLFQRGSGFWTAPMMFAYKQQKKAIHIEAWVRTPMLNRIMALFLIPAEMTIRSGGFKGVVPRNIARKDVNALLERLGQPLIT